MSNSDLIRVGNQKSAPWTAMFLSLCCNAAREVNYANRENVRRNMEGGEAPRGPAQRPTWLTTRSLARSLTHSLVRAKRATTLVGAKRHPDESGPGPVPLGPGPIPLGAGPIPLGPGPVPLGLGSGPVPLGLGSGPVPLGLGSGPVPLGLGFRNLGLGFRM